MFYNKKRLLLKFRITKVYIKKCVIAINYCKNIKLISKFNILLNINHLYVLYQEINKISMNIKDLNNKSLNSSNINIL